jgi:AcrR family transcriptional regulator
MSAATRTTNAAPAPETLGRRAEIVREAAPVILRYGFRKTSMDDVARAAKLSRQGLYLHFPNKELLFREVVAHLAGLAVEALRSALARPNLELEARLLAGFDAMAAAALAGYEPANVRELFTTAAEIAGDVLASIDEQIMTLLTTTLTPTRKGRTRSAGPSPRALAEHLYVVSYGLQHRGHSGDDYRRRMATAVRIVCASAEA